MAEQARRGSSRCSKSRRSLRVKLHGGRASLAYVIPWGTQSAASALADLFRQNVRVHSSDKVFKLNGEKLSARAR